MVKSFAERDVGVCRSQPITQSRMSCKTLVPLLAKLNASVSALFNRRGGDKASACSSLECVWKLMKWPHVPVALAVATARGSETHGGPRSAATGLPFSCNQETVRNKFASKRQSLGKV